MELLALTLLSDLQLRAMLASAEDMLLRDDWSVARKQFLANYRPAIEREIARRQHGRRESDAAV